MKEMYTFLITGKYVQPKVKIPLTFLIQSPFRILSLLWQYKQKNGYEKLDLVRNVQQRLAVSFVDELETYWFARKIAGLTILWINLFRQGEALCLERAIIICSVLRSFGLPANVVLGKKLSFSMTERYPFHAWVELEGSPVDDHIGVLSQYKRLDVIPS
ncbi:lasso peptide biosynthesis protein [Shimazuella kribbensis]|uniref:lasso peptide biosynthesis protein n=1 Tax=Shimazuella kribbensis TaxID=139808 RepID=UPI00041096F5|nr:lasso peptide biosynthesis protein [Shimazuella kribbensis]